MPSVPPATVPGIQSSMTTAPGELTARKIAFDQIDMVERSARNAKKVLSGVPDRYWPDELPGTINALHTVSEHLDKLAALAEHMQRAALAQATVDHANQKADAIREELASEQADT